VWANDIHLDFLSESAVDRFLEEVADAEPDVIALAGDISTARWIEGHLQKFEQRFDVPVCFVLGNHDYYYGSLDDVRQRVDRLARESERLHWLNTADFFPLGEKTGLFGHDGWGDARVGDPTGSPVQLSDFFLIDDLNGESRERQIDIMRRLGDEAAAHVDNILPRVLEQFDRLFFVTHVPPFREAAWYNGKPSNDNWAPFFTCHAVGERLVAHMARCPDRQLTVLCGHTHGNGVWNALPNLEVVTGGATYGKPGIQPVLEIE
jgi:predicted MPP superfamily phosphohydrolase